MLAADPQGPDADSAVDCKESRVACDGIGVLVNGLMVCERWLNGGYLKCACGLLIWDKAVPTQRSRSSRASRNVPARVSVFDNHPDETTEVNS